MSLTSGQMTQAIGPNQIQTITASALATLLSGLVMPAAHATTHKSGGTDPIKLDELAAPTDVTTLNVSTTKHGLTPKGTNTGTAFLRDDASWATILFSIIGGFADLTTQVTNVLPTSNGGTGASAPTAYGIQCGGTTSANPFQSPGTGTSAQVLISQGASALPAWRTFSGGATIDSAGVVTLVGGSVLAIRRGWFI